MRLHELTSSSLDKRYKDTKVGHGKTGYTGRTQNQIGSSTNPIKIKQLPKATNLNLYLDKSDSSSNMTSDFTQQNALDILKSLSKKVRGKEPIHTTKNGIEISVDAFGNDKSIKFKKTF